MVGFLPALRRLFVFVAFVVCPRMLCWNVKTRSVVSAGSGMWYCCSHMPFWTACRAAATRGQKKKRAQRVFPYARAAQYFLYLVI